MNARNVWLVITDGRVHAYSSAEKRLAVLRRLARRLGISMMGSWGAESYENLNRVGIETNNTRVR